MHVCLQVKMPDGIRRDQFLAWIEALSPTQQSPVWLGLPDAAENVILTTQGTKTRMKMMRMQQIDDDDEDEMAAAGGGDAAGHFRFTQIYKVIIKS